MAGFRVDQSLRALPDKFPSLSVSHSSAVQCELYVGLTSEMQCSMLPEICCSRLFFAWTGNEPGTSDR